ncbi:hypothetical protein AAG607_03300 [Citromicrobium bathyomarinum]|uniref:hypothetical protein n=1 Tax=Citromicrobium bathyomarinum TaxID=72174 RepID=UPI000C4C0164|nr:hypothetical protein [Citromicrobium sp.]MBO80983.1 hypothetical protein [Citromicrobium sp.]
MTETQIGCVSIIASVLAAFALRHSLRTGQSVAPWPHGEVTRRSSPILYWIDFGTFIVAMIGGAIAGLILLTG